MAAINRHYAKVWRSMKYQLKRLEYLGRSYTRSWKSLKSCIGKRSGASHYSIHTRPKTHSEAVKTCKGLGGKLFEPKSASVNKAVLAFARTKGIPIGKGIWIGIHDKTNEGKFTYESDGKPITWKNWNKREPNNWGKGEDCVHIANGLYGRGGLWNDLNCARKLAFVCEKAL